VSASISQSQPKGPGTVRSRPEAVPAQGCGEFLAPVTAADRYNGAMLMRCDFWLPAVLLALLLATGPAPAAADILVRDDAGREVRLAAPARRIVSLAPHLAELVHAAGAGPALVGVSAHSDHPPEV